MQKKPNAGDSNALGFFCEATFREVESQWEVSQQDGVNCDIYVTTAVTEAMKGHQRPCCAIVEWTSTTIRRVISLSLSLDGARCCATWSIG